MTELDNETLQVLEETESPVQEEELKELEGDFIWAPNRKEKIFIASNTESAYSQMISFISWVKPIQFEGSFGNTADGREAARLIYVRG